MSRSPKELDMKIYSARCAALLKELREAVGLSVQDVADALDVGYRTVYRWETGERFPPIDDLPKIAKLYKVKKVNKLFSEK